MRGSPRVGKGFENTDPVDGSTCPGFAAIFNEPATFNQRILDVGQQPCNAASPNTGSCLDFKLYTVYRPAQWPSGKIPVIVLGNGTCLQPETYGVLLRYVASYGFFVVAPNSREVGSGKELTHALDFAAAANQDSTSPYVGRLDLGNVGVMGHSQGAGATITVANDSRVRDVAMFNGGNSAAAKPILNVSGDMDIANVTPQQMASTVNGATQAAYLYYHNPAGASADAMKGHLLVVLTPERVVAPTTAWWQMLLESDQTARAQFVGASCGLCNKSSDFEFGEHGL